MEARESSARNDSGYLSPNPNTALQYVRLRSNSGLLIFLLGFCIRRLVGFKRLAAFGEGEKFGEVAGFGF